MADPQEAPDARDPYYSFGQLLASLPVEKGRRKPSELMPPQQSAQPELAPTPEEPPPAAAAASSTLDPGYLAALHRFWAGAAPAMPSLSDAADAASRVGHAVSSAYQEHVPSVARDYLGGLFHRDPTTQATVDAFKQQTSLPKTGNPVLDTMASLPTLPLHLATDQAADMTTPGWAVAAAAPIFGVGGEVADAAKTLFPKLDAYSIPAGYLSRATILKRLEGATDLAPEAKAGLTTIAEQIGDRRIAPTELHALAAGETYAPDRIVRRVAAPAEGVKQIPGAPYGVTNARQERGLRERYLKRMELGVHGRDWYDDAGNAVLFHANDDPARANLLAEDLAITSPATSVGANTGMGVKAYNQAAASTPENPIRVEAGRFPTAMGKAVEDVHAAGPGGVTGPKRTPFAQNVAQGGGFKLSTDPPRAVHDIWDAEAHGYMNPDGSPMRQGFGVAQHRWMDAQQDKILATANARGVGGFTDWDQLKSQAAAWTAQQIEAGRLKPEDAAKSYADYLSDLYAQGSRETVPGGSTGHMPELYQPGQDPVHRQTLHDRITGESGFYDPQGRDQIAAGYGGLVGRSFDGPGLFQGEAAPGRQTLVLTGSVEAPGGPTNKRVLDEGSRRILDASEATHGLLTGQDASAYSRILPAGSGAPRTGWDVALPGGTVTPAQMQALTLRLGPAVSDMVLIPTPQGIRLAQMDEGTMKTVVKALGGKVTNAGSLEGNLIANNWQTQPQGQGYWDAIRKIGTAKFDAFAPEMAGRLREIDARFAKDTGGRFTLSPVLDEVRAAINGEGFAGLEKLAKKYGIPVAMLTTALSQLGPDTAAGTAPSTVGGAPPAPPRM